jgi:iron complex outermembrane receptor protein
VNAGLDLETRFGLYVYGSYYYSDKLPLNDAATVFNPAFRLLNTKIGYKKTVGSSFELNFYGGIDNLLNESYTSIASLNAVGFGGGQPAYFNPSPKRNGYGGLNIKYKL